MATDLSHVSVVATTKSTFAGAATIKTRFLTRLLDLGAEVTLVAEGIPPAAGESHLEMRVKVLDLSSVKSTAQGALELLQSYLVQALVNECQRRVKQKMTVVLWGSHLFPYGAACIQAKRILRAKGVEVPLIIFPVGSDIWEIGSAIPDVAIDILKSPEIDLLATYSEQFASEIAELMDQPKAKIRCVLPFLQQHEYRPISLEYRTELRRLNSIPADALVFINHSNMRPVKRVDFCVELVDSIAQQLPMRETYLILLGPHFSLSTIPRKAKVLQFPTTNRVNDFLAMSDFSINASLHDSFNTALLEAMSCGAIPVTSDRPAISRFIQNADAGIVFPTTKTNACLQEEISGRYPMSERELQKLIVKFQAIDENSLRHYRQNGQTLVSSTFSEEAGTLSLQSLIEEAIITNKERHVF